MGESVKLSKISQFTAKQHCLLPLYKCPRVGEGELMYSLFGGQMRVLAGAERV